MRKYLVDTTVLVNHLRGEKEATKFLGKEGLVISMVTMAELLQGVRGKPEQKIIEKLVAQFPTHWSSGQINRQAVRLMSKYFLKFNLKFLDALMAATALEGNFVLVTDNIKHFKFISGLKVTSLKLIEKTI